MPECRTSDAPRFPSATQGEVLRVALVADCQFADAEPSMGVREHRRAPLKLAEAVETLSREKPHFAVHLGDLIDHDLRSFDTMLPIFERFACPKFHVAGNHDYDVEDDEKSRVNGILGIPAPGWRDMVFGSWRFVFLDGAAECVFRHPKGSPEARAAEARLGRLADCPAHALYAKPWNGGLGVAQREWLRERLELAQSRGERMIIFCHLPADPDDSHSLWDTPETLELLARFPHVAAWINGHNHAGGHRRIGATHFLNLKGMVDTCENTFALATLHDDRIEIRGYGREPSRTLMLRAEAR